jgi:chemotaxis protein MotB
MKRRERKMRDEGVSSYPNQVMTISLFIILLAFFILLNAYAVVDETKKLEALGSLLGSFGILPGGFSVYKGEGRDIVPPTAPIKTKQFNPEIMMSLPLHDVIDMVSIASDDQKNVVTIQEEFLFGDKKKKIKQSAFPVLDALCRIINRDNSSVEVVGHTDNTLEDPQYAGWKHSGLQALAVARYFIETGKVDPNNIIAYGRSEYQPRVANAAKETRKQNRRIDIIISIDAWRHVSQFYKNRPNRLFMFKKFVFDLLD